jgi:UDP-N-acetylmuramoyl-L-alanyl-D-glutamate--2,6-diaminopimelate ligase
MKDLAMTSNEQSPSGGLSLNELAAALGELGARVVGDGNVRVSGVRQDSRRVEAGELFVARRGGKTSGATHALEAATKGAAALMLEQGDAVPATRLPVLEVSNVKRALALAAEAVYGFPSRAIDVVGITGTNGKTTTTFLLEQGLTAAGAVPARLGTLGFEMAGHTFGDTLTTPEADDIARCLLEVQKRGGSHLVMEVSSIALVQERVSGLRFRAAAFTNLTQDHLDFHGTLEAYAEAKAELFTRLLPETSVIHVGDAFGRKLAGRIRSGLLTVARHDADVSVSKSELSARGMRATVVTPQGECELVSPLIGEHNLENLLVALGVLLGLGQTPNAAAQALSGAPQVPGRLERCEGPDDDVLVAVDYAHTPDALARVLKAVRTLGNGRVLCVFGCGGDRDPKKRAPMGEAVGRGADYAYVTSDNPRSEAPQAIALAILPGLAAAAAKYEIELDRAAAIEKAILAAAPGDVVVIAGKGHEDYQIVGAEKRHFDDREEARRALALRRGEIFSQEDQKIRRREQ